MPHDIHLSIRALAEFLLRAGSIDARFSGLDRGGKGSRMHRRLQRQGGADYTAELPLGLELELGDFVYHLSGRADGVLETDEGLLVDEIKTTTAPLGAIEEGDNPAHWAQGACYAHILCEQRGLPGCGVRLTYANVDTGEVKRFLRDYTSTELADFVHGLLGGYERWARLTVEWKEKRDASLRALAFPFGAYRDGQRKMAVGCYNTFRDGGRLFACAPTGIGKTMSALFPAMKALGEGHGGGIFYLTAKTVARAAAEDALSLLRTNSSCSNNGCGRGEKDGNGLHFRSLTLTAKDKVCFLEERMCTPEACPYAEGYYDRLRDAVYEILQGECALDRAALEEAAKKYRLCPYELSLDLAEWCDCVICDYNYLFDPVVRLQRFFEGRNRQWLFLVDEAHNLVDRSRDMYSAQLRKGDFLAFKKLLPAQHKALHRALGAVNKAFLALRRQCETAEEKAVVARWAAQAGEGVLRQGEMPEGLQQPLERFAAATENFLDEHRGAACEKELLALYFEVLFYQKIADLYGDNYETLLYRRGGEVTVRLLCLDAADYLDESLAAGRAAVLFSATLQPLPYYRETLGGGEGAKLLALGSPFEQGRLGLFIADGVSTKYVDRPASLLPVADLLAGMVAARAGNYIAYFPSYSYMRQVEEVFSRRWPDVPTLVQAAGMDEAEREAFLASFAAGHPEEGEEATAPLLGFCVLGGLFAEGVDLPGERLVGAAVVGVGLPQMGPEPDALRAYYDEQNGSGFEYAYQFPGMNKVLQAAGRVIRTAEDVGVVLLIDSRFGTARYRQMFPAHWSHWRRVGGQTLPAELAAFWRAAARGKLLDAAGMHPQKEEQKNAEENA